MYKKWPAQFPAKHAPPLSNKLMAWFYKKKSTSYKALNDAWFGSAMQNASCGTKVIMR